MKKNKRFFNLVYWFVMLSFVFPIAYTVYKVIVTPNVLHLTEFQRSKADYTLMLLQCMLGIAVINLPSMISRRFKFEMPVGLYLIYIIFLYCAIFLGEIRNFYYAVPHWDDILHCCSSMMTGLFGFMSVAILNHNRNARMELSPFFIALFAFCFSMTIGSIWEIYEFFADGLFGLNMQKFITADGTVLSGHKAISDTMKDIVVDGFGALLSSVIGFFSIKNGKGWIHEYLSKKKTDVN